MRTKLIFSTETKDTEQWTNLPFVPRIHEWFNVQDIFKSDELEIIKNSAKCWSGVRGRIESVEYRQYDNEVYTEIFVWCED
jgi:hypothetical protein